MTTLLFILFFASAIFTAVAITQETWPRAVVAFGGLFTGIFMIPIVFHLVLMFR